MIQLAARGADEDVVAMEMRHRLKNIFAIARAIALQTETKDRSAREYRDVFLGRFQALLEAENLLEERASDSNLQALLRHSCAPFAGERLSLLPSPVVILGTEQVLPLGLIFHELSTNALKYGALSVPTGRICVGWSVEETTVQIEWREEGGPPVQQASRSGFGTRLIQLCAMEIGGQARLKPHAEGLVADISFRAHENNVRTTIDTTLNVQAAQRDLAISEAQIRQAELYVTDQWERIDKLRRSGRPVTLASQVLDTFETSLRLLRQHRALIRLTGDAAAQERASADSSH
jgi:two-component sensor histidine kinase